MALCTPPRPRRDEETIDLADLPALHYLYVLSQSPDAVGRTQHAYVVIDEAQDVSPLDLLCLRRLEQRPCFTLLGDLAQSIYAHRGLTSWDEAAEVFAGSPYRYAESRVSYRTTAEITALANRVRRGTAAGAPDGTRPVRRRRPGPGFRPPRAAARALRRRRRGRGARGRGPPLWPGCAGRATPAWGSSPAPPPGRRAWPRSWSAPGSRTRSWPWPRTSSYRGGVIVLPVALAKGLEFDAAVVVDADAATYGPAAFDARLLYVALTRAMHALRVVWAGSPSPHLGDAEL